MRLPRDISGEKLAGILSRFGYVVSRRSGSHIRLTTERNGTHHVTIPSHKPLKVWTLHTLIKDIAEHLDMKPDELMKELFSWSDLDVRF